MFPRYVPRSGLGAWSKWLLAGNQRVREAWSSLNRELGCGQAFPFRYVFDRLKTGLYACFCHIRKTRGAGHVLVSSQICAAVPLAAEAAGLLVRFVDIDASYPTPGAQQFAAAIDDGTVAVIVAPMYGHVQSDWTALLDILGERTLILDLAQGLSLERRLEALCRRADAVTYSFGVGKGLDTGGGLVLARKELHPTILSGRRKYPAVGPLVQTIALRLLIASGLYPMIAHRADQYDSGGQTIATTARLSPESIAVLWNTKLKAFLEEVRVACERAAQLGESSPIVERVRYPEIYFGRTASHLRQVIRLNDPLQRDFLVAGLRAAGIDCAPAGEAFPCSIGRERISRDFPNAARFRNDAIRLPFLGRMSVSQFQRFQAILERTLVKYLP